MRILGGFSFLPKRVANSFPATYHCQKLLLHANLKAPKENRNLKRYLNSNCLDKVLFLFRDLLRKNLSAIDSYSFTFVLKACTKRSGDIEGKSLHGLVIKLQFESVIYVQTSLVNLYSAVGELADAQRVFDEMPVKNIICWTALISACVDNQNPKKALDLFRKMWMDNVEPDQVTVTVALSACADLGALEMGQWIHNDILCERRIIADQSLNNALLNMYAKCGDIEMARRLFDRMGRKDVMTWTSMIVGHAVHGQAKEALELFAQMKALSENVKNKKRKGDHVNLMLRPNDVTFVGVLMACSHGGMVEEGKRHFKSMSAEYDLNPRDSHFGCMVDLFCRAGLLKEAYDFIMDMELQSNAVVWRTLLGACSLYGNIELGREARSRLLELEPHYVGDSVALSNIYASKSMWDCKTVIRSQIKKQQVPGCSSIETGSGISEFVAGDEDHPLKIEIYKVLMQLMTNMQAYGYSMQPLSSTEY